MFIILVVGSDSWNGDDEIFLQSVAVTLLWATISPKMPFILGMAILEVIFQPDEQLQISSDLKALLFLQDWQKDSKYEWFCTYEELLCQQT